MSTILSTEVVPSTSDQQTLLVYDLLDAHHDTAPLAADGCARRPKRLGLSCVPRSYTKPLTSAQG